MKVVFIDQFSELGGAQRCLLDLLPVLPDKGWEAQVVLPGNGPMLERLNQEHVDVTAIRSSSPSDLAGQVVAIRSLINRTHPDLVYVNGPRLLPAAALAAGKRAPM